MKVMYRSKGNGQSVMKATINEEIGCVLLVGTSNVGGTLNISTVVSPQDIKDLKSGLVIQKGKNSFWIIER